MAHRKIKIETEKDYKAMMVKIDSLMKKGEANLTHKEAADLKHMALAAQAYEKSVTLT